MLNETFSMIFKHRDGEYLVCSSSNFEEVMSAESSYGRGLSGTFLSSILVCVQLCIALLFSLGSYRLWGNYRFLKRLCQKKNSVETLASSFALKCIKKSLVYFFS